MSEVYDHLLLRDETKLVDMQHYLTDVCQKLSATISGVSPIAVRAEVEELFVHSEIAVPIAMIVNEVVTNSLKYGFPEGRAGVVTVRLKAAVDSVEVSVTDNGIGYKENASPGLGSRIVALLTQQLGGTIDYERLSPGCRVTLRMPKPPI
jgi:two-component sensor histidine kinase